MRGSHRRYSRAAWRLIVALGGAIAIQACAQTKWTHPASDPARTAADLDECDRSARIAAQQQVMFDRLSGPRVLRDGAIGYPSGRGGFYERNSEWYWSQQFLDACMRQKGYHLTRVD